MNSPFSCAMLTFVGVESMRLSVLTMLRMYSELSNGGADSASELPCKSEMSSVARRELASA